MMSAIVLCYFLTPLFLGGAIATLHDCYMGEADDTYQQDCSYANTTQCITIMYDEEEGDSSHY